MSQLTAEELRRLLRYNEESGSFTWLVRRSWRTGDIAGTVDKNGYRVISIGAKKLFAHRLAWLYVYGKLPTKGLDHINGDKQDNRIQNLREATVSQNMRNKGLDPKNTSGYKGVTWNKRRRCYTVQAGGGGKRVYLGFFADPKAASDAYQEFTKKHYGEFYRDTDKP